MIERAKDLRTVLGGDLTTAVCFLALVVDDHGEDVGDVLYRFLDKS